ncbi:unnamed protein product [Brachionus calyciflorus]|uniref:Uncharacterized protein n=1 Tax=Brachionus calyciflorus TaxID=104777 RepID=A0A814H1C2_9BILA|nr:unnamed protein product [Brachionus calyciflorus]
MRIIPQTTDPNIRFRRNEMLRESNNETLLKQDNTPFLNDQSDVGSRPKFILRYPNMTSSNENDDSEAIIARSQEIKNIIENSHNTAKEKNVYIKCEGLLTKLEARFKGPYKVVGLTSKGNYKLKNSLGEKLPDSYPRHKLKIVENNQNLPEESAEIERILGHKVIDNNFHYLVK